MTLQQMLQSHPMPGDLSPDVLRCIDTCIECGPVRKSCADAYLGEQHVDALVRCITLALNCSAICEVTAGVMLRRSGFDWTMARTQIDACAEACRICKMECRDACLDSRALPDVPKSALAVRKSAAP